MNAKLGNNMTVQQRISAWVRLGEWMGNLNSDPSAQLVFDRVAAHNPWFTWDNVNFMLQQWTASLKEDALRSFIAPYRSRLESGVQQRRIAVVMAGNIPLAGLHDLFCVLICGHQILGKLSSKDNILLPFIAEALIEIEPRYGECISFTEERIHRFDAVIASGSDQSAIQFERYFASYPHIIRKNRTGIAVLSGNETASELELLCDDIFLYFGLGCRSVTHLMVPRAYDFERLFEASEKFRHLASHHKYASNLSYFETINLVGQRKFLNNGIFTLQGSEEINSPIGVIYYTEYDDLNSLLNRLNQRSQQIQCTVSHRTDIPAAISFGQAQRPKLSDFADGIDTLNFLLSI